VEALEEYSIAIKIAPDHVNAMGNRAQIYLKAGDVQSAMADFQKSCSFGMAISCERFQVLLHQKNIQGQ